MDAARKPKRKRADKEAKDDEVGGVAEIAKKMKPKQQQPPKQQPAKPNTKVKKDQAEAMTAAGVAAPPNPKGTHQSTTHMAKMRAERDQIHEKKKEKETKEMEENFPNYSEEKLRSELRRRNKDGSQGAWGWEQYPKPCIQSGKPCTIFGIGKFDLTDVNKLII